MACFLKLPTANTKGVLTFTSLEYKNSIARSPLLYKALKASKKNWIFGMHNNNSFADHDFHPDPFFDFYFSAPGDLKSKQNEPFIDLGIVCSIFSSNFFAEPKRTPEKFYDVLYIGRDVKFKSLENILLIIRKTFDIKPIRVLAIIAHQNLHHKGVGSSKVITQYQKLFSSEERKLFTLLTPSVDYPFPLDLHTLAFYYHHSKVFLGGPTRHSRVAAYAWAAGLRVVAPDHAGALLSKSLHKPPGFYIYRTNKQAAKNIHKALQTPFPKKIRTIYSHNYIDKYNITLLKKKIKGLYATLDLPYSNSRWITSDLNIRLGRHNTGKVGRNSVSMSLSHLTQFLSQPQKIIFPSLSAPDFEKEIAQQYSSQDYNFEKTVNSQIKIYSFKDTIIYKAKIIHLGIQSIKQKINRR